MRKIFTSLKSVVSAVVIAAMAFSVSCSYDDTAINQRVDKVEKDLAALTERVGALESKLQTEVDALKALIDGKVVIVDVITGEDGKTTIKLSNGESITVVNECKYVACDHECIPCDHECTPCDCDTLKYRVVDGVLEVSADGETWVAVNPQENPCDCDNLLYRVIDGVLEVSADGETWVAINGVAADQVVVDVVLNEDGTATIELATGEKFTTIKAELIECEAARNGLYVLPGETKEVALAVNDAVVDINIMNQPFGWSATVEEAAEAPETGDEGGVAPMPLAAGGKNYVVKINGPAATLTEAAKSGVVSVHFNTAAGACKVLSIDVNLAELTLEVDGAGNITITNSVVATTSHPMMGSRTDFADFHIGIVDAADYATYGDHIFAETFYEEDGEYMYRANVASTKRTGGFFNVIDEPMWYEEGVCEIESYTLTPDQLAKAFYPYYEFELGKEYIIFVTSESEMADGVEHPVLTNADKGNYKRVSVQAKIVEDSITWNDATAEFNLAGFDLFVVGWVPVADLQDLVTNGVASDVDSALGTYVKGNGIMSSGAIIPATNGTLKLSELANISMTGWAPELNSGTEHVFFVYAFNGMTEMEIYMHQFNAANLYNFGTFSTAALKLGNFDAAEEFTLVALEEKNVEVKATFGEDVKTVAYTWSKTSYMDPEEAAKFILDNVYTEFVTFDEYTTSVNATKFEYYGIPENYYLCVLAINEAGEYVYVEFDVHSEQGEGGGEEPEEPETPAAPTIDKIQWNSAKAQGGTNGYPLYLEFGSVEGYTLNLGGYIDIEYPDQPYLNGAWYINYSYNSSFNAGMSYLSSPDYNYTYFEADYGYISISESEGKYWVYFSGVKLSGDDATYSFGIACDIEGLILPSEYKVPEGLFVPVRAEVQGLADTDSNWKAWFYDASENCLAVEGYWDLDAAAYGAKGQYIPVGGEPVAITVTKTQTPIANGTDQYYFNFEATWEGGSVKMQALSLPVTAKVEQEIVGDFELVESGIVGYTGWANLFFKDANGTGYCVSLTHSSIDGSDPVIPSGTYTWTTDSEDDFTLYGDGCTYYYDEVVVVNNGDGTYVITIKNIDKAGKNGIFTGAFGTLVW